MIGDGDHVIKTGQRLLLVGQHFSEFHAINQLLERARAVIRVPSPDLALDIVLEQNRRDGRAPGEVDGGVQEIADRNIRTPWINIR